MRNAIVSLAFSTLFSMTSVGLSQTIVENPAKPDNPRAGRVVTLEEVMRIEDTEKDFYIKAVYGLKATPDGSVFVRDGQDQLLQFDPQGHFIRNLMKRGQGPREMTGITDFLAVTDKIILFGNPPKLLAFDLSGNFINEIGLQSVARGPMKLILASDKGFLFSRSGRPDPKAGSGWQDIPQEIVSISINGEKSETIESFATPAHVNVIPSGGISMTGFLSMLYAPLDAHSLALSHTSEYLVKVFDIETRACRTAFRRSYERQRRESTEAAGSVRGSGVTLIDLPPFLNDISRIHEIDGRIWIQTSTTDLKKGILFDVFTAEGKIVDQFFLKWTDREIKPNASGKAFVFSGGYVYFDDRTEDDLVVIRKCRMIGL